MKLYELHLHQELRAITSTRLKVKSKPLNVPALIKRTPIALSRQSDNANNYNTFHSGPLYFYRSWFRTTSASE